MPKRQSQAWKNLERETAGALGGTRVTRGANFAISDVDVILPDLPQHKIDAKYRVKHSFHKFLEEIVEKYCEKGDIPVLVTKSHNQVGAVVSVYLSDFAVLLDCFRVVRKMGSNLENSQADNSEAI
jgi:hypothetical protein